MRILTKVLFLLLIASPVFASDVSTPPLICQEADGSPSGVCTTLKLPNGTLTQSGASFTYAAGAASTATALAANGGNCNAGNTAGGVDEFGTAEECFGIARVTGANTACDTTCTGTCIMGFNTDTTTDALACADAAADVCLCFNPQGGGGD